MLLFLTVALNEFYNKPEYLLITIFSEPKDLMVLILCTAYVIKLEESFNATSEK